MKKKKRKNKNTLVFENLKRVKSCGKECSFAAGARIVYTNYTR